MIVLASWKTWLVAALVVGVFIGACVLANPDESRRPLPIQGPGVASDPVEAFRLEPEGLAAYKTVVAFPSLRFNRPLYLGSPADGTDRLFVCEQDGRIYCFPNRRDVGQGDVKLVLDISAKTRRMHNEEGLLGLAFHPKFRENGYIYLNYSATPRRNVVSRFTLDPQTRTVADPASEFVILEQPQPFGNHNGGCLEFGPDGYLYISFGDGGAAADPYNAGQNEATWLGKILRIDIDRQENGTNYAVPKDNPFVKSQTFKPEIWATGLRNVWRFTFDRASGLCIGGDVGQNQLEEIDILRAGKNYGWRAKEGTRDFGQPPRGAPPYKGPFEPPIIEYGRDLGSSVTGGYVYRGKRLPGLQGAYLYADFDSANVWALRWDGEKVSENKLITRLRNVASFGEDAAGEIYLCSFDGQIHTLLPQQPDTRTSRFPVRLSETGLFESLKPLKPAAGLVAYDVAVPLWSSGADKSRWIRLPKGATAAFDTQRSEFEFPPGTIFVKHFSMRQKDGDPASVRALETRVLIVNPRDGVALAGYTYVWNDEQTDALLLSGSAERTVVRVNPTGQRNDHQHYFPSRSQCLSCHTPAAGHILGFTPAQLNWDGQLAALSRNGVLSGVPADTSNVAAMPKWSAEPRTAEELERSVRAYLDANCANCHRPGGSGNAVIDLRRSVSLADTKLLNAEPGQGTLGVADAKLLVPGVPERSLLYRRMAMVGAGAMPNIGHTAVDQTAVARLEQWIRHLK